jgi:hypothetical protein
MSIKPQSNARIERTNDTPEISRHAVERYRQRIDRREPFPEAKLEDLLAIAEPVRNHRRVTNGIGWVARDALLVTDSAGKVVKTVLRREGR